MARPRLPADVLGIFVKAPQVGKVKTRLAAAYARHFAEGAARIVVIGSDCPRTGLPLVCQAFQALDHDDLVIGPAPELFGHITWSTDAVFRQTMANADALGLRTAVLPELRDVDTVEDARALDLLPSVWSTSERRAIRTAARQLKS